MALTLSDGTVIPTELTRHASTAPDGTTTLPDGRVFVPALLRDTDQPCTRCEQQGMRTYGGYTPRLKQRDDDGFIGCITHDGARLTGMTQVSR